MSQLYHLKDFKKITTTLYYLGYGYKLSIIVEFIMPSNETNKEDFFYSEYNKNAYLNPRYSLVIGSTYENPSLFIPQTRWYTFVTTIGTMKDWLTINNDVFYQNKGENVIRINSTKYSNLRAIICNDNAMELVPMLKIDTDGSTKVPAIGFYIESKGKSENVVLDTMQFLNFAYFIQQLNPMAVALSLINTMAINAIQISNNNVVQQIPQSKTSFLSVDKLRKE